MKRGVSFRPFRAFQAFSLVEVVLAMGVAAFGILSVFALLPVGIQSTRDSMEESEAVNLLSGVVADRMASPLAGPSVRYKLPALLTPATPATPPAPAPATTNAFGIMDDCQMTANLRQSHYRVYYSFKPPANPTLGPCTGYFKVSWPAGSNDPITYVEAFVTFPQP